MLLASDAFSALLAVDVLEGARMADRLRRLRRVAFLMTGSMRAGDEALLGYLRARGPSPRGEAPSLAAQLAGFLRWLEAMGDRREPAVGLPRLHLELLAQPFAPRAAAVLRLVEGFTVTTAAAILRCSSDDLQGMVASVRLSLRPALLVEAA
jgi:hypothetical protein